jgi:hypothetical protein
VNTWVWHPYLDLAFGIRFHEAFDICFETPCCHMPEMRGFGPERYYLLWHHCGNSSNDTLQHALQWNIKESIIFFSSLVILASSEANYVAIKTYNEPSCGYNARVWWLGNTPHLYDLLSNVRMWRWALLLLTQKELCLNLRRNQAAKKNESWMFSPIAGNSTTVSCHSL